MASAMATPLCKFSPAVKGEVDGSELVGRTIRKFFSETGEWYNGTVQTCEATLTDATTGEVFSEGPYFNVRYEDGDEEDLDLQELQGLLVNDENQGVKTGKKGKRGKQALSQHYSSNANMKHEADNGGNPPPPSKRRKSDEKKAAAAAAAANAASTSAGEPSHPHEEQRAGQLYKLHLENFMCHENFSMTFGPHVNFISGTNGSGKSAVLQGIQACLGVRASDTGRSNSLNSFIREGATSALIAVTVYNTGEDAYEPLSYGDFITVERRLGASGSAFTLKNGTSGRVIARGRAALTAMLDSLDLNASNPVAVLTQDTARTFLAGSASDKKKFDLFMEATLLEQISETQRESECRMDEIKAALNTKKRALREQKDNLEGLRDKVQELRTLAETMKYNEILGKAYVWKKVYEKDPPLNQLREKVEVLGPKKLKDIEEQHMEASADVNVMRDDMAELKAGIDSCTREVQALQKETKEMQAVHKGAKQKLLEADRKVKSMRGRLAEKEQEVQNVIASADEVEAAALSSTQAAMDSHKEQVQSVEMQITQAKQQLHESDATWKEQQAILGQLDVEDQELKHGISRLDAERKALENELNQMKKESGGGVVVEKFFANNKGHAGKQLLSKIESRRGEFHKAPVGPIGRYLSIKDETWAQAVEIAIGGTFNKFLVHDQHDAELLRAMAKQFGLNLTVVIRRLDLPPHNPKRLPEGVLSVMDMVSCKEPELEAIVGNYLLDAAGYESIALADSHDEARHHMYLSSRVFMRDGHCMQKRGASESSFGAGRNPPRPRLVKNNASALAMTERQLQDAREALESLQRDHKDVTSRRNAAKAKIHQAREQGKKLGRKTISLETNLETICSQRPDASNMDDPKSVVEAEIRDLNSQILDLKEDLIRYEQALETASYNEKEAKELFTEKTTEVERLARKNDRESAAIVEKVNQLKVATQRAEELNEKKQKIMDKIEEFRLKKEKGEKERADAAAEAMELCDEAEGQAAVEGAQEWAAAKLGDDATEEGIEELLDSENLMHELSRMIQRANAAERQAGGTLEDLEQDLARDDKRYKKDSNHFHAVVEAMGAVQRGIMLRRQSLKKLDRNTEANVQSRFKHYMSLKGNVGTIKLNRDEGKLIMSVTMSNAKNEKNAAAVEDLKSLSGGERSFTTVSFILALGEITDNPFRAMDEFDVFMDAVNRRISMQSLIKFAHDQGHVQFLFLTPQDIAAVEDAKKACEKQHNLTLEQDFIKVVCMQPARNS